MGQKRQGSSSIVARADKAALLGRSVDGIVEKLEQRILLSANDGALVSAMAAALRADNAGLAAGLQRLKDSTLANSALPMVGNALSSQYALGLQSLLEGRVVGPNASFADLRAALEGPGGLADGIAVVGYDDQADHLEMTLRLQKNSTIHAPIDVSGSGVNLSGMDGAGIGTADLAVGVDFTITIGAQLDGVNAAFYVNTNNEALKLSATIVGTHLNSGVRLGTTEVAVGEAQASLSADVVIGLGGEAHVGLDDLGSAPGAATVVAATGSVTALQFEATSELVGNQIIAMEWPGITAATIVTTNLAGTDPSLGYLQPGVTTAKTNNAPALSEAGGVTPQADLPLDAALQAKLKDVAGVVQNAINGIDKFHDFVFDRVLNHGLPMAGNKLKDAKDTTEDILNQVKARANEAFTVLNGLATVNADAVRNAFYNALGPSGLNVLPTIGGAPAITFNLVDTDSDGDADSLEFVNLDLKGTLVNSTLHPNFDIGLPSLGMAMTGAINIVLGYEFHLKLGVDAGGFYVSTAPTGANPEFKINLDITLPNLTFTGNLAFLRLVANDDGSLFHADFGLDFKDGPDADTKLSLPGELGNLGLDASITGNADVKLHGAVTFQGNPVFPSLSADFHMAWGFNASTVDPGGSLAGFGNSPVVEFNNARLNLGTWFSDFVAPVTSKVREVLKPLKPVLDVFRTKMPVLSDIPILNDKFDQDPHDGQVTLLEVAEQLDTTGATKFISILIKVDDFVNQVPEGVGGQYFLDLGRFSLAGSDTRTLPNLSGISLSDINPANITAGLTSIGNAIGGDTGAKVASFLANAGSSALGGGGGLDGSGLHFPILENPAEAFKLFLGQHPLLFSFGLPELNINYDFNEFFPILGPLGVRIQGHFAAHSKLFFGYDTYGIEKWAAGGFNAGDADQIFDGFFVSDTASPDGSGPDTPELTVDASFQAHAELNLVVFSAGVGGGIFATIHFNLHDPNTTPQQPFGDGKIRVSEIIQDFQLGPQCIVDVDGKMTAALDAYVKVGVDIPFVGFVGWEETYTIAEATLLDFSYGCQGNPNDPDPILATVQGDGTLRLNMGPYAADRVFGDTTDSDENFVVTHLEPLEGDAPGTERVRVEAFGYFQDLAGVTKIYAEGGGGSASTSPYPPIPPNQRVVNDVIKFDGVTSPVEVWGDFNPALHPSAPQFGDDNIELSNGASTVHGGGGHDKIILGTGAGQIFGDGGDDTVQGGDGNDTADGGAGNDIIYGNNGADNLSGGIGDDVLNGGTGQDILNGDDNNDRLIGGSENDFLFGGNGFDILEGDGGNDQLNGGADNDVLIGDEGTINADNTVSFGLGGGDDTAFAGSGNDAIYGQGGADVLNGESGNDYIEGNAGADLLSGGDNDDKMIGGSSTVLAADGNDIMTGDAGNDLMIGDDGRFGSVILTGGVGADNLNGGIGNDSIYGQGGNDTLTGDVGLDYIEGNAGADNISGGDDDDVIIGGSSTVTATDGGDLLNGDGGNDLIIADDGKIGPLVFIGGAGADTAFGGSGNDTVYGQAGPDTLIGGTGDDNLNGNDDADVMAGDDATLFGIGVILVSGAGADTMSGGNAADLMYGQGGGDVMNGDAGTDYMEGDGGSDTMSGGSENDKMVGGGGVAASDGNSGDVMNGDAGDDIMIGDDGSIASTIDLTLISGTGNDTISGGTGNDLIHGQGGADVINGNEDDDDLYGDAANDTIHGNGGKDRIWASDGDDSVFGDAGNDVIRGEIGNDTVEGGDDADEIIGGVGDDSISGNAGPDTVYAGDGNDIVHGQIAGGAGEDNARDQIYGENGNDQLFGEGGPDILDGGAGIDTVSGDAGNDQLYAGAGIGDQLLGGEDNDRITGSDEGSNSDPNFGDATYFGDIIDGGAGNDTIDALGGADNITGGEGDDSVNSGAGIDLVHGAGGNDWLYAGVGDGEALFGDAGNDTVYGSDTGPDIVSGGDDNDKIFGQGGNDTVNGDAGDDYLDGGTGTDLVSGGIGNDEALAGYGNLDTVDGGDGDDILRGSDEGADNLIGGIGRDRIYGNAGNDTASGGAGDDTVDGGAGDDQISGDGGPDLLLGGANHDIIYGHSSSGSGDDNAVDYIYGDFGTNGSEPASGRDQLFGQGGNDFLYGEGDDDAITAGGGGGDLINFGSGEGAIPSDFVPPTPTPPPTVGAHSGITQATSALPTGADYHGRWPDFSSSSHLGGLSASRALAIEPAVIAGAGGVHYVAWVDGRNGNDEIYVAKYTGGGTWSELAGSAGEGGISYTSSSSRRPSIALDGTGNPIVAWTEFSGSGSDIRALRFDPAANGGLGAWVALGTSAGPGGLSATGSADNAQIVNATAGPTVAWLNTTAGIANVYVKQFSGGNWNALGAGSASGSGVSASATSVSDLALATSGANVAVAWTQTVGGVKQIYMKEHAGAAFNEIAGSATAGGVSNTTGESSSPALAYLGSSLFAVWQDTTSGFSEIYGVRYSAGVRNVISVSGTGISSTVGNASQPNLATGGGVLHLAWADDTQQSRVGSTIAIYARKWNGTSFIQDLSGDAAFNGISFTGGALRSLDLAVNVNGQPFVAWNDQSSGSAQIYDRGNTFNATGTVYNAGGGTTIQQILDANNLNPGDIILLTGSSPGFTIPAASDDAGILIRGLPGSTITSAVSITQTDDITLQGVNITGSLTVAQSIRFTLRESTITGGITLNASNDAQLADNTISGATALTLTGASANAVIEHNTINGSTIGLAFTGTGATNVMVRDNIITAPTGISIATASSGTLRANNITATTTGITINTAFTGSIDANDIHGAATGVNYAAAASLKGNLIHDNTTGVVATVAGIVNGFGFVSPGIQNEIYSNTTGVNLTGQMQNQHIHDNTTGVTGSGILGGGDLALANLIEKNTTGVNNFSGTIQFNRIAANATGINASNGQKIFHNLIYRNTQNGLLISGKNDVRIVSNTFYAPAGDNIRIQNTSSNIEIRDNILWAESGYDVYVANDSQTGFFSDYNDLHATGTGKLFYWTKDFTDILDFQADVAAFDLHSIGRTVVNPNWSEPRFINRALDDYRIFDLISGQRFSSPTVDAGDPITDQGLPAVYANLLSNGSFDGSVNNWTVNTGGGTQAANPTPFDGSSYFYAGAIAQGFAEQTVDLLAKGYTPAQLDSLDLALVFGGRVRSANEAVPDRGQITLTFLDGLGQQVGATVGLALASNTTDRWELIGGRRIIPQGTRSVKYRFQSDRSTGSGNDSYLDSAFVFVVPDTTAPDQGAYANTSAEDSAPTRPHIALRTPDLYTDVELFKPRSIRWDSYNNVLEDTIRIDLLQDTPQGPQVLLNIISNTQDDGDFTWIPDPAIFLGIDYGTYGLRIQVSFTFDNSVIDRSTENFTIPENGDIYYVDDASNINDEYTPAAIGSNRNTGKLPTAPKPNPVNVLRTYELTAGATLNVDTGTFPLIYTAIATSKPGVGLGTDRGFTFRGPTDTSKIAELTTAIPNNTSEDLIYLDDADLMKIRFLTLNGGRYGIYATGGSTGLIGEGLIVHDNAQDGILLDAGSDFSLLKDITTFNHANDAGLNIQGGAGGAIQNLISNSNRYGLFSNGVSTININGASLFYNTTAGLHQDGSTTGNFQNVSAYGNQTGLETQGTITLGNSNVYDNIGTGVFNSGFLTVQNSSIHGNVTGVGLNNGQITGSRIYSNLGPGVQAYQQPITLTGNTLYTNQYGLLWTGFGGGTMNVANNLIYGDAIAAIRLTGYQPAAYELVNNTIYEPTADGVYLTSGDNLHLRNNIIWTQAGYGIFVANDSQFDFASNFNDLYATGAGKIGYWQGDRATLTAWQFSNFRDGDSLSADPKFVTTTGLDGITGAPNTQGLIGTFYTNRTGAFAAVPPAPVLTRTDRQVSSTYAFVSPDPSLLANDNWSVRYTGMLRFDAAGDYTFYVNSLGPQRLKIDGVAIIDDAADPGVERVVLYHAASAGLVPIEYDMADDGGNAQSRLEWSGPTFTRRVILPGHLSTGAPTSDGLDDNFHEQSLYGSFKPGIGFTNDAQQSPAIDRGRPGDSFANEPAPAGGYVNVGAYGNTAQASKSPLQYVLVTNPNGGERLAQKSHFNVRWRSDGFAGNVRIEYSTSGFAGPFADIIATTENDGAFDWTINPLTYNVSDQYVIRISSVGAPAINDVNDQLFSVIPPIANYYVNDNTSVADEYTTAPGDDLNDGLTPATPKASIRAILDNPNFDLEFGDTIFVDTGVYNLTTNIPIGHEDSGIRIQGPTGAGLIGSAYQNFVLADNPSVYYRLGETSGTTAFDATANHRDGAYANGATLGAPGAIRGSTDTAASFDGVNDHVQLPTGFNSFPNGITMEAWVFPTGNSNFQRLFDLGNGQATNNIIVARNNSSNDLLVQVYNGSTVGPSVTASGVLLPNRWQHIAVTITAAGAVSIYWNGRLESTGNVNPIPNTTRNSNYIGRSNWATDPYYRGSIDEAAIYDKVLTVDRIATHYLAATGSGAVLNRGNVVTGSYVFELNNADAVTLSNLSITGAYEGVFVNNGSSQLTVQNSILFDNANAGLNITDAASSTPIIRD
ncbi:MAG TPA: right-handed parallel beta-helix repeat-containing protein, partial [Tepidisphaeraceae bacterium]|nr:right-handed parallel beta-helix repeat-containing protein [Tepidisphaeraceae bacterium]